jgi:hypothetical protein
MRASDADPDGYCTIRCIDGGIVSIGLGTLNHNAECIAFAVECEALTDDAVCVIFALARAGNMSIGTSTEPASVVLTSEPTSGLITKQWPEAFVATTASDLSTWLHNGPNKSVSVHQTF